MKKWTEHQSRDRHLLDAEQVGAEFRVAQSSMTTLDRTQLPASQFNKAHIKDGILHKMWVQEITSGTYPGEINYPRDANTPAFQWIAPTYQTYGGSWQTLSAFSLTGFLGGNLYVEWHGNGFVNGLCNQTLNNDYPANPKHLGLRILVAGVKVAEKMGPASGTHSFRVFGNAQMPPGDHQVLLQWRGTPSGPDDITENQSNQATMQFHAFGCKSLAIGRHR
jgi:hypothetical protein